MKPKILLRIASVLIFFKAFGHTLYVCTWKETTDPVQKEVVRQMTTYKFLFGGTSRSAGDYYNGFGYIVLIAFILIAIILWMTSSESVLSEKLSKKLIFTIAFSLIAVSITEIIFFFPFITILSLVAGVLTLWSGFILNKKPDISARL